MIFRIAMLIAFVGVAYFAFVRRNRLPINLMTIFVILGTGGLLIIFPEWSTALARLSGVGRGVDLINYTFEIGLLFICVHLFSRLADLEGKLIAVARELALAQASQNPLAPAGSPGTPPRGPQ